MSGELLDADIDDESPWRRGSDVEFDRSPVRAFVPIGPVAVATGRRAIVSIGHGVQVDHQEALGPGSPGAIARGSHGRPGGRVVATAAAIVVAVACGLVVATRGQPAGDFVSATPVAESVAPSSSTMRDAAVEALAITPSCGTPRLPSSLSPLWASWLDDTEGKDGPIVSSRDHVAVITVDAEGSRRLRVLDADDGALRWQLDVLPGVSLIGLTSGVLLTASSGDADPASSYSITAFDAANGALNWTRLLSPRATFSFEAASSALAVDDPEAGPDDIGFTSIIDVASGTIAVSNVGRLVSIDAERRLVTLAGEKVIETSEDPSTGGLLGGRVPDAPFAVVGEAVVSVSESDGAFSVSRQVTGRGTVNELVDVVPPPGFAHLGAVTSIIAVSETAVVFTTNGFVVGAELVDDRFDGRWFVNGALLGSAPSERGRTLLIAGAGGATQSFVDAASGTEFLAVRTATGGVDVEDLYPNGVLIRGGVGGEPTLLAYDLDGEAMWPRTTRSSIDVGHDVVYSVSRRMGTGSEPPTVTVGVVAFGTAPVANESCGTSALAGAGVTR